MRKAINFEISFTDKEYKISPDSHRIDLQNHMVFKRIF